MRKLDFIIAGVQKGGTTALDNHLREHPEICMANQKEVHFFDNETVFAAGPVNYHLYHSFFSPQPQHRVIGEATPIYTYWPDSIRRIWEYNPHIKLIILLRDPIKRAYSHWNMERDRNLEQLSFDEAIAQELARCRTALPLKHRVFSYTDRGYYAEQLRNVYRFFPHEQVLVLKSEDLKRDPKKTLNSVTEFLQISPWNFSRQDAVHARQYTAPITLEAHDRLKELYYYEVKALEQMLSWDCSDWLEFKAPSEQ